LRKHDLNIAAPPDLALEVSVTNCELFFRKPWELLSPCGIGGRLRSAVYFSREYWPFPYQGACGWLVIDAAA